VDQTDRLIAIEEIKALKARYFYGYDTKDWELWRSEVWAPDGHLEIHDRGVTVGPRDAMIEWVMAQSRDQVTVHHGTMPMIDITSDTTATGIWAMEDLVWRSLKNPNHDDVHFVHGWGHYHEKYVNTGSGWRILSTRLTRIRAEYHSVNGGVSVSGLPYQ